MNDPKNQPDFAPADRSDGGRKPGEWQSKYPDPVAQRGICVEAGYLAALLLGIPIVLVFFWLEYPKQWFGIYDQQYKTILKYSTAWLGGTFGGTLFDVKWLYHSVARQMWHLDRRLWRLFTPHISGGLAFAFVALISSGILHIFDQKAVNSLSLVVSLSFLVGYFSDNAVAKLMEIADTVFGASRAKEKHMEE
jgi:hypothetical protein